MADPIPECELPTPEELNSVLRCEPITGKLFWRERTPDMFEGGTYSAERRCKGWNTRYANKEALTDYNGKGYRKGKVLGRQYRANRVIWAMFHGVWPKHEIDHINGIRDDNRISNLRDVTRVENLRNRRFNRSKTDG